MFATFGGSFAYENFGCAVASSRWMRILPIGTSGMTERHAETMQSAARMMETAQISSSDGSAHPSYTPHGVSTRFGVAGSRLTASSTSRRTNRSDCVTNCKAGTREGLKRAGAA